MGKGGVRGRGVSWGGRRGGNGMWMGCVWEEFVWGGKGGGKWVSGFYVGGMNRGIFWEGKMYVGEF